MEYDDFLAGVEPVIMGMDSHNCSLNRRVYWSLAKKDGRRVLSSKYSISDIADDHFDVEAVFSLSLEPADDSGNAIVAALKIECVYTGHFHAKAPLNKAFVERFAEESWVVFWPYFRQFVSDTTARMAIPPVTVPFALGPGSRAYRQHARVAGATAKAIKTRSIASRKK